MMMFITIFGAHASRNADRQSGLQARRHVSHHEDGRTRAAGWRTGGTGTLAQAVGLAN